MSVDVVETKMGLVSACPGVTTGWVGVLKWVGALWSRKALTTLLSIGTAVLRVLSCACEPP